MRDGAAFHRWLGRLVGLYFAVRLLGTAISAPAFAAEALPGWRGLRSQGLNASERGSYPEAERLLRASLALLPNPESSGAVALWNEIGEVQQAQSRLADAEQDFRRAIEINRKLSQSDDFEMAVSLNDLAAISHAHRQFASAESLLRQSYALLEKNHGSAN